ncbi:MAG: hypothetical protein J1E62_08880 [Lachnospiraceae bacterium]|nr:hypothetical protein [Lachnospiraceae bacterium]
MSGIVNIHNRCYSYEAMEQDLNKIAETYPRYVQLSSLGETLDHRQIYCLHLHGDAQENYGLPENMRVERRQPKEVRKILVQAAMHAREWKNTQLVMMMAEKFLRCYKADILWEGIPYRQLLRSNDLYILPMTNPDGVQISQFGVSGITDANLRNSLQLMMEKQKGKPASIAKRWKGNARGVDLNRNFEVGFPCEAVNPGENPLSEPESKILWDCITKLQPALVVNYHSTGQEIFYRRYFTGLEHISRCTGYPLVQETEKPNGSLGDILTNEKIYWCTLETGMGRAPVWHGQIYAWWFRHQHLLPMFLATVPGSYR